MTDLHDQLPTPEPVDAAEQAEQRPTVQEVVDSLTGWDELGIKKGFGRTIDSMTHPDKGDQLLVLRAAAAVVMARRDGVRIEDRYRAAMDTTQAGLRDLFQPEPDDVLPDDPDSAAGKGDSQPSRPPTSSPTSVSGPASLPPSIEGSPV